MTRLIAYFMFISATIFLASCEKDDDITPGIDYDRQIVAKADWTTETFKEGGTTIQFPTSYVGDGAIGFEGLVFNKNRDDNRVSMAYFYCNALYCDPYGDHLLPASPPAEMDLENPLLNTQGPIVLDERYTFSVGDEIVAYLYLRACEPGLIINPIVEDAAYARLFLTNGDGQFAEALDMVFDYEDVEEVLDIIGTIQLP